MSRPSPMPRVQSRHAGVSPLEWVILGTFIAVLGSLALNRVSSIGCGYTRCDRLRSNLKTIVNAADLFRQEVDRYPATLEELKARYGAQIPKDPWGNDFRYQLGPDGKPRVRCLGKDGREGGEGEDRDFEEPEPAVEVR